MIFFGTDFFLFFFRRFCNSPIVMSIRRVGHILLACFGHARRKSWFRIVFYSILQLWGISSKGVICSHFWVFLCELCVLVTQTENLDFAMFFKYFWAVSTFRNNVSLYHFFFLQLSCLDRHVACIRCMSAFSSHWRPKLWFRIVFYSIFVPWAPVQTFVFCSFVAIFANSRPRSPRGLHSCMTAFFGHSRRTFDFVLFFKHFGAVGTSCKDLFSRLSLALFANVTFA